MSIPKKIRSELEALIMFLETKGARGLTDTLCAVPIINQGDADETRYAVAVKTGENYIPLAFLGTTMGVWEVAFKVIDGDDIEPFYVKDPSASDILAQIPTDALPAFNDDDLLCTDEDVDDDAWDED